MTQLSKKTVFITGASSGFGKLTAKLFQKNGWQVYATMRSPDKETELTSIENIKVARLDVMDRANIDSAMADCVDTFGSIDVLVNNAGYGAFGFLEEASPEEIAKQMDVNFLGVVSCIQAVLPTMRAQQNGVIINVSSIAGSIGMPFMSLYNASKFAVEGLTQSLQFELASFGIKVRTVAPGAYKTSFVDAITYTEGNKKTALDNLRQQMQTVMNKSIKKAPKPFGYGDPQEVADQIYACATKETPVTNMVGKDAKLLANMARVLGRTRIYKTLKKTSMPKFR